MMTNINDMITAFEVDVRFPDVSGMEHLDMLLNRSELARAEQDGQLSNEQRVRLAEADRILLEQVDRFYGPSSRSPILKPGVGRKMRRRSTGGGISMC